MGATLRRVTDTGRCVRNRFQLLLSDWLAARQTDPILSGIHPIQDLLNLARLVECAHLQTLENLVILPLGDPGLRVWV